MDVQLYNVGPRIPEELKFLETLSNNIWWCWHPLAIELFVRINPNLWRELSGNAKEFLRTVPQSRLEELAHDPTYRRHLRTVQAEFERVSPKSENEKDRSIAYFSLEFGIHESIRIFSGGLGVLGPGADPLAVTPAVGAEQANGFAAQRAAQILVHRL